MSAASGQRDSGVGSVWTAAVASLLGDDLDRRREELSLDAAHRGRVGPADIAALAAHVMIDKAVTAAKQGVNGGQQFVA